MEQLAYSRARLVHVGNDRFTLKTKELNFQRKQAFVGVKLVPDTHRLLLMNCLLHGIDSDMVLGDTLSPDGTRLPKADVMLTNPPFGTKTGGGKLERQGGTCRSHRQCGHAAVPTNPEATASDGM